MHDEHSTAEKASRPPESPTEGAADRARAVVIGDRDWGFRLREALAAPSGALRWTVESAETPEAAAEILADAVPTLLVLAPEAPPRAGELAEKARAEGGSVRVVSLDASVETSSADRLRAVCERELELLRLRSEVAHWRGRFRDLYDRSLAGLYRIDASGVVVEANETFARLLGHDSRRSLIGTQIREFVDPEDGPRPLRREGQGWRPFWSRRVCLERRDGSRLWGLLNDQRLGSSELFEGSLIEATREHDLAAELLQQEALYVEIFGAMTEPTLLLEEDGVVLACNHRAEGLLDRRAVELVGRPFGDCVREVLSLDGRTIEVEESPLFSGASQDGSEEAPLGVRRLDGKILWLTVRSRRIPAPRGSRSSQYLVSMVDRTELRELSQRAQRAQVESLLTQGLVHDVRNLLTAVRAAASFLEIEAEDSAEVRSYAEQIDRVAASANVLLSRALEASRDRETTAIDVDRLINEVSPMLRRAARDRRLTVRTGAPGLKVRGDRVELEQILFNLLSNAREATAEEGRVDLRTLLIEGDGEGLAPCLRLEVEDDGCGMSEEVRRRAFEPLFTSRRASGGGGLGLFNVAHIVREMGGRISFESELGQGTIARLDLPLLEFDASATSALKV